MADNMKTIFVLELKATGEWYCICQTKRAAEMYIQKHNLIADKLRIQEVALVREKDIEL